MDKAVTRVHLCIIIYPLFISYMYFIFRSILDFDFEKLCSISLSHINVYACLVCGKYFQGLKIVNLK